VTVFSAAAKTRGMFTRPNFLQGANNLPMVVAALVDEILVMATVVDFAHIPVGEMGHSLHRRQILGARKRADIVHRIPADAFELRELCPADWPTFCHETGTS